MLGRAMEEHNHQQPTAHRQPKSVAAVAGDGELRSFACLHDFGLL